MIEKKRRILLTGGAGFIGLTLAEHLVRRDYEVLVFSRRGASRGGGMGTFLGDVTDPEAVIEAVGVCDAVVHLAGLLGTSESMNAPERYVEVNILGSLNVFEAARLHARSCVNVSVGNYWENNPYAISKSGAERFAMMYNKELGANIVNLRLFNTYGPRQKARPARKLVPNAILAALEGKPIEVNGDGGQEIDLIYVDDVVETIEGALGWRVQDPDEIIELGTGRGVSVIEVVKTIIDLSGSSSEVLHRPMRSGEATGSRVVADVDQLLSAGMLDRPFTSLENGLQKTIAWYRETKDSTL